MKLKVQWTARPKIWSTALNATDAKKSMQERQKRHWHRDSPNTEALLGKGKARPGHRGTL